jgi:hypothetical protein
MTWVIRNRSEEMTRLVLANAVRLREAALPLRARGTLRARWGVVRFARKKACVLLRWNSRRRAEG